MTLLEDWRVQINSYSEVDVHIQPPNNANDDLTDEDSGDEDNVSSINPPGLQLLAPAELPKLFQTDDNNEDEEEEETNTHIRKI